MKESTIYRRDFQHTGPEGKGKVYATAQLYSLGNQAPHFSLTETEGCANHERILEVMPELRIFADLHLADREGVPMHAEANAAYHIAQKDIGALSRHLSLPEKAIMERWGAEMMAGEIIKPQAQERSQVLARKMVEELRPIWKKKAEEAIKLLSGDEPLWEDEEEPEFDHEVDELIRIGDEEIEVMRIYIGGYLPEVDIGGRSYLLADGLEAAEKAVSEYWFDMAKNGPEEFVCMVGEETMTAWGMGQEAGPGTIKADSMRGWIEKVSHYPEEQWAGYDGAEVDVEINYALAEQLGFTSPEIGEWTPVKAYRNN